MRAAVFALFIGCTVPKADYATSPRDIAYQFVVDVSSFSPDEILQISAAAADWVDATSHLEITVGYGSCPPLVTQGTACIVSGSGELMHEAEPLCPSTSVGCWAAKWRRLYIDTSKMHDFKVRLVTAHEIGHVLGLVHDHEKTVMYHNVDEQTLPTCRDVKRLWKVQSSPPAPCRHVAD